MAEYIWLMLLGLVVGTYGTLIGAGGGFVLVPALLLLYPNDNPEIITSISLAVVFFNAASGSIAYTRMKRIDFKSAFIFAGATIPGAILGALSTSQIPRKVFDIMLGGLMLAASAFLLFYTNKFKSAKKQDTRYHLNRILTEKDGTTYTYSYNMLTGISLSFFIGFISSFLGIGGGIIHVPVLTHILNFPVHLATATSHLILAIIALTGTIVHVASGSFTYGIHRTAALAVGVLIGAQLGALLSNRIKGKWIIKGLAIGLAFVGLRLLITFL
jgi:uncharacterized protein